MNWPEAFTIAVVVLGIVLISVVEVRIHLEFERTRETDPEEKNP